MSKTFGMIALLLLLLAGCGEYRQSVAYDNGGYQGKQDARVWESERFFNDKSAWKQMVNERTQRQNEYDRTGD
jgi:uncharacterized membrane-anchored protein